jgi:hypothetical protein
MERKFAMKRRGLLKSLSALILVISVVALFSSISAVAVGMQLVISDKTKAEELDEFRSSFDGAWSTIAGADAFKSLETGSLKLLRIEDARFCTSDVCLTLINAKCDEQRCPTAAIFARDNFLVSDVLIELMGGAHVYRFSSLDDRGVVLVVTSKLIAVTAGP